MSQIEKYLGLGVVRDWVINLRRAFKTPANIPSELVNFECDRMKVTLRDGMGILRTRAVSRDPLRR